MLTTTDIFLNVHMGQILYLSYCGPEGFSSPDIFFLCFSLYLSYFHWFAFITSDTNPLFPDTKARKVIETSSKTGENVRKYTSK